MCYEQTITINIINKASKAFAKMRYSFFFFFKEAINFTYCTGKNFSFLVYNFERCTTQRKVIFLWKIIFKKYKNK